jgi:hypothetical protein
MQKLRGILAVATLALSACASWTPEPRVEEGAFQALNAVDAAQTANIKCTGHYERVSDWGMGHEPSSASVVEFMGSWAIAHALATDYMVAHHWPTWAVRFWEASTIVESAADVRQNVRLGIRVSL